jgi:thiamine-phosphate pyrophosphorylase
MMHNGRMDPPDLRLIIITDRLLAAPRSIDEVVHAALSAGACAIQLRDKTASARELYEQAIHLGPMIREQGALFFINDRLDVALAADADGVHVGPDDLPVEVIRRCAPSGFLIGVSTDDPETARRAESNGASYIGCGAVFGTTSKKEVAGEWIGLGGLREVAAAVSIPVIAIGGIDSRNVAEIPSTGAAGIAVIGAIMTAPDPAAMTQQLMAPFSVVR